jgi:hypothetical protein
MGGLSTGSSVKARLFYQKKSRDCAPTQVLIYLTQFRLQKMQEKRTQRELVRALMAAFAAHLAAGGSHQAAPLSLMMKHLSLISLLSEV